MPKWAAKLLLGGMYRIEAPDMQPIVGVYIGKDKDGLLRFEFFAPDGRMRVCAVSPCAYCTVTRVEV